MLGVGSGRRYDELGHIYLLHFAVSMDPRKSVQHACAFHHRFGPASVTYVLSMGMVDPPTHDS